jgi:PhzF family phenazine biosynthesis protein
MRRLPLYFVDAFAARPFEGNPAAVVPLDAWLPDAAMQAMAAEHNLSETAFCVPEADGGYALRWFTPRMEVPLCGHATLATAFVLTELLGHASPLRFATASGELRVAREGGRFVLDFPANPPRPVADAPIEELTAALGARPAEVWRARDWICVFEDPAVVRSLRPDHGRIASLPDAPGAPGGSAAARTIATAPGDGGFDVVSRYFAARIGIPEDPVTGAAHTQLIPFWAQRLGHSSLICRQASARGGTLWCELADDRVRMGGHAVLYARGEILLPEA